MPIESVGKCNSVIAVSACIESRTVLISLAKVFVSCETIGTGHCVATFPMTLKGFYDYTYKSGHAQSKRVRDIFLQGLR